MNLLQLGIKLKSENVQSFIDDFMKVDGITISDIKLYDDMILINKIKYKSFGTIALGLKIDRVEDGILSITIKKLRAISIPISIITVNFILKMVLNKLNIPGITSDGKQIKVDLYVIFKKFNLDFIYLDIKDIQITEGSINIELGNIDLDLESILNNKNKEPKRDIKHGDQREAYNVGQNIAIIYNNDDEEIELDYKIEEDFMNYRGFSKEDRGYFSEYSRVRSKIYNEKFRELDREFIGKILFLLPDIGVLSYRLLRDKRVKKGVKAALIFTIAYLLNPFELINNKFKILNRIDDGLLLVFTLNKIFTSVNREILEYHFEGDKETLDFLIDSFDILNELLGIDKINKLYTIFEKFIK